MFSKAVVASFVLAPFISSAFASDSDCTRTYTVVDGDYCDSISAAQNVSTYQLAALNPSVIDSECSNLAPGTSLCLGTSGEDCTATYVVKANDTCDAIAETYSMNTTMLYTNNPQIDETSCGNIYIGEVLCVDPEACVPAEPSGTSVASAVPSTATLASAIQTGSSTTSSDSSSSSDSSDEDDDEDDSDLPWCDEL